MATMPIFSADSHTMEPADLWVQRMDRGFRDRAPRVIKNHQDKKGKTPLHFASIHKQFDIAK